MTDEQIKQQKENYRLANRIRSQQNLIRLVNANKLTDRGRHSFLTLTYKKDQKDVKTACRDFAKFIQRLNYTLLTVKKIDQKLRYVAVIEFQDKNRNGVIHFHVILFNVPFIHYSTFVECWTHGNIDIRARDKSGKPMTVTSVARYMGKYMAKGFYDDRLNHKKKYFGSINLERPVIVREPAFVDHVNSHLPLNCIKYSRKYQSKFMGNCVYVVYEGLNISTVDLLLGQQPPPRYSLTDDF